MERNRVYHGDCLEVMADFPDNTFDSVITDPPYGLFFMGRDWDHGIPGIRFWAEMLRVCKPGAMLFAFGGTRTHHRLMTAIEDAGWEIRDCINHFYPADEREAALLDSMSPDQVQAYLELHYPNNSLAWLYGQGFPKSHALGKAIDRAAGMEREVIGTVRRWGNAASGGRGGQRANGYQPSIPGAEKFDPVTAPATPAAQAWDGHGTALKPAWEPIIVAMKPIAPITSNALYQATGWDHWHHDTALKNTPKNRLKLRKKGVILKPDYGELELKTVKRKALHPGVESDTLLLSRPKRRHRSESSDWQTVGRYDVKPYRRWKTNSFAANALVWGVAGLWIDGARIGTEADLNPRDYDDRRRTAPKFNGTYNNGKTGQYRASPGAVPAGRWPANVLMSHHPGCVPNGVKKIKGITGGKNPHKAPAPISVNGGFQEAENRTYFDHAAPDGTETVAAWICHPNCPIRALDEMSGESGSGKMRRGSKRQALKSWRKMEGHDLEKSPPLSGPQLAPDTYNDTGTAARFFKTFPAARFHYTPKASRKERNQGLDGLEEKQRDPSRHAGQKSMNGGAGNPYNRGCQPITNHHPTVKPQAVVEWLCRLSRCPSGGLVLDPFGGSGTTALACLATDRDYILIEKEADYVRIARARIAHAQAQPRQLSMLSE